MSAGLLPSVEMAFTWSCPECSSHADTARPTGEVKILPASNRDWGDERAVVEMRCQVCGTLVDAVFKWVEDTNIRPRAATEELTSEELADTLLMELPYNVAMAMLQRIVDRFVRASGSTAPTEQQPGEGEEEAV